MTSSWYGPGNVLFLCETRPYDEKVDGTANYPFVLAMLGGLFSAGWFDKTTVLFEYLKSEVRSCSFRYRE